MSLNNDITHCGLVGTLNKRFREAARHSVYLFSLCYFEYFGKGLVTTSSGCTVSAVLLGGKFVFLLSK